MKAITAAHYGGPETMQLQEVPTPTIGDDDVLVALQATSLQALDWHLLRADPAIVRLGGGLFRPKRTIHGVDIAGGYAHGAADALLAVLDHARETTVRLPPDLPFERGSLAARLLLEIEAGVHGANTDLAERLGTDKTQLSRAGRRLRQLRLAESQRDGRLNRWTITPEGTAVVSRLRRQ